MQSRFLLKSAFAAPLRLGAMLVLAGLLSACAQHLNAPVQATPMPETRFRANDPVRITPADSVPVLYAYLYTPVTLGPYPSIVTIPGGGWTDGDATDMRFVAEYLAQRGFAVLAIEHRPAAQGGLEQVLADLHAGMRWMVRNARAHRLDMQRVGLLGFESGGHLAALLALAQNAQPPLSGLPRDAMLPAIRAVVAGGAPMDLTTFDDTPALRALLQGNGEAARRMASPVHRMHAAAPPFFLFHGTRDAEVPIAQAEAMAETLTEQGVRVEFYRMELRGHTTTYLTVTGALQAAAQFLWRTVAEPETDAQTDRGP